MYSGTIIVWGSIGGEIMGQYRYTDIISRNEAITKARQHKADIKAGRRQHPWGKNVGIADNQDGVKRPRVIK